jgi:uncharacterized membrane protein
MNRLERFLLAALGVLVVLAVAIIFIGPRVVWPTSPPEQPLAPGETETMPARVIEVLEEGVDEFSGYPYQRLLLRVESGSLKGQEIEVSEGTVNVVNMERLFSPGDRVYVARTVRPDGVDRFYISDFVRTTPLFLIAVLFVGAVVLIGRGRGVRSLLGTLMSLAVIFGFILPQIVAGRSPIWVSVAGSVALVGVATYLTYGVNFKSHAAMMGMILSLILTALIAQVFVTWTRLTGLGAEESAFLVIELGTELDFRGVVLSGIIIGALGVLDDICVGQASAVFELARTNREMDWRDLFRSSLNIGRDHIAAMVNTLLLAYVGASLPLMLVFNIYKEPIWRRINREPITEEIVRTLVGSVGLILAVPITGLIASLLAHWAVWREETRAELESKGAEE